MRRPRTKAQKLDPQAVIRVANSVREAHERVGLDYQFTRACPLRYIESVVELEVVDSMPPELSEALAYVSFREDSLEAKCLEDVYNSARREKSISHSLMRTIIAHEAGHISLHLGSAKEFLTKKRILDEEDGMYKLHRNSKEEKEADLWAVLYLVPLESLLLDPSLRSDKSLAREFLVDRSILSWSRSILRASKKFLN